MFKKLIFLFLFLISFQEVFPQKPINIASVDKQTYDLFMQGDWDGLIQEGRIAISEGITFYYLHYRLGIAYYNKRNYHKAITHFREAWQHNPTDQLLAQYLYYSYLNINRTQQARIIAKSMTHENYQGLAVKLPSFLEHVSLTYNMNKPRNQELIADFFYEGDLTDGLQFLPTGHDYLNLGIMHPISPRLSVYHAFTRINKNHFIYYRENGYEAEIAQSPSNLNQYYLSLNYLPFTDLNFSAGIHLVNIRYPVSVPGPGNQFITITNSVYDYLGFVSVYHNRTFFTAGLTGYYSEFSDNPQFQADATLAFYPFRKFKFLYCFDLISKRRS
jgi:tetratricopeptide (TPR) repeat protein